MAFGPLVVDPASLAPGTLLLGKYRVERTLGEGGMGVVVSAEHVELGRRVAIKLLLPAVAKVPDMAERFMREARAATKLAGDYVAQVLDVGRMPDGLPFMVMEYLEGEDLQDYRHAHPNMPVPEAIEYVVQAGAALASAHRIGIVHRDVKPANFFLTKRADGTPIIKVLDFGISKFTEDNPDENRITKTTAVMGSVAYMSPEQMRSAKNVDRRTDIYALGVVLYELLAGTQPYVADSPLALAAKVSTDPPDPISRHRADVPAGLAKVLEKGYAKRPDDRYQTVEDFLAALSPFASEETRTRIAALVRAAERARSPSLPPRAVPAKTAAELEPTALLEAPAPTTVTAHGVTGSRTRSRATLVAALAAAALAALLGWMAWGRMTPGGSATNAGAGANANANGATGNGNANANGSASANGANATGSANAGANTSATNAASAAASTAVPIVEPAAASASAALPSASQAAATAAASASASVAVSPPGGRPAVSGASSAAQSTTPSGKPARPKVCLDENGLRVPCK